MKKQKHETVIMFNRRYLNLYHKIPKDIKPYELIIRLYYSKTFHLSLSFLSWKESLSPCNKFSLIGKKQRKILEFMEGSRIMLQMRFPIKEKINCTMRISLIVQWFFLIISTRKLLQKLNFHLLRSNMLPQIFQLLIFNIRKLKLFIMIFRMSYIQIFVKVTHVQFLKK